MRRPRPNLATVAVLETLLDYARNGELQDIFAVYRCHDGEYGSAFITEDLGDMLLQVRTEVIHAQIVTNAAEKVDPPPTEH